MKIYLNVRLNLENTGQTFTVWPRPHRFLPGLEFFTGSADCLSAAITDLWCVCWKRFTSMTSSLSVAPR